MTVAVLSQLLRPHLEGRLPDWLEPRWFASREELNGLAPEAEIGWFDGADGLGMDDVVTRAVKLKWLNTVAAGVDPFPLDLLRQRGVVFTNGAGINAITIAEYAVMGMLSVAKGFREVLRAADRHEWLAEAPGKQELYGSSALVLGAGAIGGAIADRLAPFGVKVAKMRRRPGPGELGPDTWRAALGGFDWVIVTVPATPDTDRLIGAAELAAMKPTACVVNVSRGTVIDQPALIAALREGRLGHAFLDVTDPEPLPPDHPLWALPNATITMHLSGRSQTLMFRRSAERFLANLQRWSKGEPLEHTVDLALGY
jgi:phosphoglycerate dehydrogenase-like enzyme